MTPYQSVEYRYHKDPVFKNLVANLVNLIGQLQMTPTEVREAAMFACMIHESQNPSMSITEFIAKEKGLGE